MMQLGCAASRSSCKEYPKNLALSVTIRNFAASNYKKEDGNRKIIIAPLAGE